MSTAQLERDLTIDEVATIFRVHRTTVMRWCHSGELGHYYAGRYIRVKPSDVDDYKDRGGTSAQRAKVREDRARIRAEATAAPATIPLRRRGARSKAS